MVLEDVAWGPFLRPDGVTTLQIKALNAQVSQLALAAGRQTSENQQKVLSFISLH